MKIFATLYLTLIVFASFAQDEAIDSLQKENHRIKKQLESGTFASFSFVKYLDSNWTVKSDTGKKISSITEVIPDSASRIVAQRVQGHAGSIKQSLESIGLTLKDKGLTLRKHQIEWHRKISLSMACLVLFLIGAPLGSIIRKGGLGTPLIFAIAFFMLFFFSNTSGEKMVKGDSLTPFVGMWLASFILLPIGFFLTYKAMHDSQLFNKEFYARIARLVRAKLKKRKES